MHDPAAPRILYLTYDGLTDPLGQSQVLPYLAGLSKAGYRITLVSSEKPNRKEQIRRLQEKVAALNIDWLHLPYTKSPPILSTLYDIWKIRRLCKSLFRKERYSIVHCRSYIPALIGVWLKRRYGVRFIFDMRGFFADERIDGGMWIQSNFIYRIIYRYFKRRESDFLESADTTVCLTEDAFHEIRSWRMIRNQPLPLQVIPCCVDIGLFQPDQPEAARQQLRERLGFSGSELVISYVGAVGTWYMLDEMLDFFQRALLRYPDARFLFITQEDENMIYRKAAGRGIPASAILVRKANREEVPLYLSLCQVSIFFIKPVYSKKASSPAKLGEIMSMGIPVICNSNIGDTDRIIREAGAGAIVRSFTTDEYDFVINDLERLRQLPKEPIREAARNIFSLEQGVSRYKAIYQKLTG
jgi:glycosyltransferase involved in cell wall biosynthesis